jgi:hypothetical protein
MVLMAMNYALRTQQFVILLTIYLYLLIMQFAVRVTIELAPFYDIHELLIYWESIDSWDSIGHTAVKACNWWDFEVLLDARVAESVSAMYEYFRKGFGYCMRIGPLAGRAIHIQIIQFVL